MRTLVIAPVAAAFSLLLLATPAQAAPPAFQAISAIAASPGADVTVTLPAHQADDILLLIGVVRDQNDTVTVSGWTQMTGSPFDRAGVSRYWVFWKRAASASETNPVFNKSGGNGDTYAAVINYRGALATGDPWEVKGAATTGTTDPATCVGITTLTDDSLVVAALAGEDNNNASVTTSSTNPAAYAEHYLESGAGSDGMIAFSEAARTTAGATGNVSVNFNSGNPVGWGCMVLALKPIPPPPAAGGFNAYETSTASGAITGVIKTKIAGSTISLDMIALNAAKDAIATTFTGTVRVEVLNASNNTGALDSNGCRPTWTVIQTLSPDPTFTDGRDAISFTQANSYPDVRLRITYPAGAPTVTGCSNDNFAIRPSTFASFAVSDADWETAGTLRTLSNTGATGGNVHKAGRPFTVQATAVNGAGTPATTTNYAGAPTATPSDCGASSACPATLGTFTVGASFVAGQLTSNVADYSEVGSFALQLVDSTFSSVDASDGSTPAERNIVSSTINVGRFVPDYFDVTSVTEPVFRTFNDAACATRSFTYIGQRFAYATIPMATIAAKNSSGGTTTNYTGALWKLTNASASQAFANSPVIPLDTTGIAAPTVSEAAGTGTGTYTASASDAIAFVRDNATPQAFFNANLSLTVSVSDATEAGASQGTITTSTALVFNGGGSGIGFDSGNAFRYGRLTLRNANGSQLVPLPVPIETQYWNGTAFITNTDDSCTSIANDNVAMSTFAGNLAACETAVSGGGTLSAGRRTLLLAAPGSANDGSVVLTANLGAAASGTTCTTVGGAAVPDIGANRIYLQGNWTGGSYDQNPPARETFGVYKGSDEVIFIRENF